MRRRRADTGAVADFERGDLALVKLNGKEVLELYHSDRIVKGTCHIYRATRSH